MYPLLSYLEYRTSVAVFAERQNIFFGIFISLGIVSPRRAQAPSMGPTTAEPAGLPTGSPIIGQTPAPVGPRTDSPTTKVEPTSSPTTSEPSGSPVVPLRANVVTTLRNVPARDMTPRETEKYIELLIVGLGAGLRGIKWLAFCLSEGFLVAATTYVGQCVGANVHKHATDVAVVCCSLSAFTTGDLGFPFVLFSEEILQALVSDDEGIVRYCAQYVYVIEWVMSLIGFEMACYGCLLGAGRASIACFVNGACNILRIPLTIYCLYSSQPAMEMA